MIKMKIIYLANIRIPTEKAHGLQVMKMCQAFQGAGADIKLVVAKRKNPKFENMDVFDYYKIKYVHECKIIPHKRFDFWLDGIILEVKKKKPSKITLLNQLNRYTKPDEVKAVIVVLEESMDLPKYLNGKPIFVVSLNANWGVAI